MKVPEKLKILIGQLQHHGDIAKIQQATEFSRYRISQVLDGDDSSDPEVIEAVMDFYKSRQETLSDFIVE
jgi:hypothetical protein